MSVRSLLVGLFFSALFAGAAGCKIPGLPPSSASSCGGGTDRCAALNCPPGMHCTLTSNCAALCEQEQLSPH